MAESAFGGATPSSKKKSTDQGFLAGVLGKAVNIGTAGKISEGDAAKNVRSATDFVDPRILAPALLGAGRDTVRAIPTAGTLAIGALAGQDTAETVQDMKDSPLSFMLDPANVEKQQALANSGNTGITGAADKFNAVLGTALPVGRTLQEGFATTGLRGGAVAGAGLSQATGNGKSIDEASQMLNVESYGQAAQHGGLGGMVLGDLLNVAPALKGAGAGGALNPLADTAAAQAVSKAGAALEAAPIMPVAIPGRGLQTAAKNKMFGGTGFPRLAESSLPGTGVLSNVAEKGAAMAGEKMAGHMSRAEVMGETAKANAAIGDETSRISAQADEYAKQAVEANKAGDEAAALALMEKAEKEIAARTVLENQAKKTGTNQAIFNLTKMADEEAKRLGVPAENLVPTDAFARVMSDMEGTYQKVGKYDVQEGLPKVRTVNEKSLRGEQVSQQKYARESVGQQDLFGGDLNDIRNIPESFTESRIAAHLKGLDTPTLPKEPFAAMAVQGFDKAMTAWKTSVLPLRPAWHATNAVGNAMGAMLLGEVNPIWFAKNADELMQKFKAKDSAGHRGDPGLQPSMGRGMGAETPDSLRNLTATDGKFKRAVGSSYKQAEKVDDFAHMVVAEARLEKNLAAGMSKEAAYRDANAFSLKAMGDFGNMASWERATLRRVMPFYPWYKHTAKATLRFPMENPGRFMQSQAWANRLQGGPQETPAGGDFLKGQMNLGSGQFARVAGDVGLGLENPLLDPGQAFAGVNPLIQGIGAGAGFNLARGRMLEATPGQSKLSATGGYLMNQTPLSRLAADISDSVRGEGDIARGDTRGAMVANKRPIAETRKGLGFLPPELISYLSGTTVNAPDLKAMGKRAKTKEKTEAGKEKSYAKAVKKQPKK